MGGFTTRARIVIFICGHVIATALDMLAVVGNTLVLPIWNSSTSRIVTMQVTVHGTSLELEQIEFDITIQPTGGFMVRRAIIMLRQVTAIGHALKM